jgi:hypothetical protein
MQAAGRTLALIAVALLLAGCVRVNMDLDVSAQNTVSGTAVLAVDKNLVELSGQSVDDLFSSADLSNLPQGATVDPYDEDGFVGQQITFDAVPLSEFSGGESLGGTGEELSITRVGDEFHVSGNLDMSGSEFDTSQVPQQFLENFEFRISITFPGPVTSSTGAVDGNTVTWEPKIGQNTQITAVASAIPSSSSPWLLIVLVAAGGFVIAAILFLVFGRRRTPAPAAEGFDGAVAPADAGATAPAVPVDTPQVAPPGVATDEPPPLPSTPGGATPSDEEEPPPVPPVSG